MGAVLNTVARVFKTVPQYVWWANVFGPLPGAIRSRNAVKLTTGCTMPKSLDVIRPTFSLLRERRNGPGVGVVNHRAKAQVMAVG